MSTRLKLRFPTPVVRIGLGASLSVLGLLLLLAGRPLAGGTIGIAGIVVAFSRERRSLLIFVTGATAFWCCVGFLYWNYVDSKPFQDDLQTLAEWMRDYWGVPVLCGLFAASVISSCTEDFTAGWRGLEQDYADVGDFNPDKPMLSVEGVGQIGGTPYELVVSPNEAGIVVGRKSGRSLLFRWEKISRVIAVGPDGNRIRATVSRSMPTPLELDLPWASLFWKSVPGDVPRVDG